jgi:hypothetical protein
MENLFSRTQQEILMHRLDASDCIADALDIPEDETFDAALRQAIEIVRGTRALHHCSALAREILEDAAEGSTFMACVNDAVDNLDCSPQKRAAYERAADYIAKVLDVEVPRA